MEKSEAAVRPAKKIFIICIAAAVLITNAAWMLVPYVLDTVAAKRGTEMEQIVHQVGKHMLLPHDEKPGLATITDVGKLKNQKFFAKGKNGDKILIYAKWQRAIIYRPSEHKIVDVGPVDIPSPAAAQ